MSRTTANRTTANRTTASPAPRRRDLLAALAALAALALPGLACSSDPTRVPHGSSATPGPTAPGPHATAPGPHATAPGHSPSTSRPMTTTAPFEIRLRVDAGPTLVAELHNATGAPLAVVIDSQLQPADLLLTGPSGPVAPFDSRSIAKFDNTVFSTSFTTVAPGATVPLGTARVTGSGGKARLQFGPFQFDALPPGPYRATVVLKSTLTAYTDDAGKPAKMPNAWTGTVTSPEVTLQIP